MAISRVPPRWSPAVRYAAPRSGLGTLPAAHCARRRCETYLIDPPTAFVAGSVFAFIGRRVLVARSPSVFGSSGAAAVFFSLWYALSVGWATYKAPDWMLNYFVPADEINLVAVHAVFILCALLGGLSGHTLTAVCLVRGWTAGAVGVFLAGGFALLGLWGLTLDRYVHVGTYAEYAAGTAALLPESYLAPSINVLGVTHALAFGIPAVLLWRRGQRLKVA